MNPNFRFYFCLNKLMKEKLKVKIKVLPKPQKILDLPQPEKTSNIRTLFALFSPTLNRCATFLRYDFNEIERDDYKIVSKMSLFVNCYCHLAKAIPSK